jgi:hypothetical protein
MHEIQEGDDRGGFGTECDGHRVVAPEAIGDPAPEWPREPVEDPIEDECEGQCAHADDEHATIEAVRVRDRISSGR